MMSLIGAVTLAVTLAGCQASGGEGASNNVPDQAAQARPSDRPVAYLNGKPVTQRQMYGVLVEMDGGLALSEILLDRAIADRLQREQVTLTQADLEQERERIIANLSDDEDTAARLLQEMRSRRGLGQQRYESLLRRNAGLRKLVVSEVDVADPAVRQAYELRYGPRYRVRLIVAQQAGDVHRLRQRAVDGQAFMDLASEHSTDASAAQGGMLSPISPADTTYPAVIRDVLPRLSMDSPQTRLSPVIAIDGGFALLWLEEVIPAQDTAYEQVRDQLESQVRLRLERVRMEQLARTLIERANVVVLDPALNDGWDKQKNILLGTP